MADNEVFTLTRTFAASIDRLWAAWTAPDQVSAWMGPPGTTATNLKREFRPGGLSLSRFDSPGAPPMWGKLVYQEVAEPSRLVWAHSSADEAGHTVRAPWAPNWPLELLTTVAFEVVALDETRVTFTWAPLNAPPEDRATFAQARDSIKGGWSGSFDRLAAHLVQVTGEIR